MRDERCRQFSIDKVDSGASIQRASTTGKCANCLQRALFATEALREASGQVTEGMRVSLTLVDVVEPGVGELCDTLKADDCEKPLSHRQAW